MKLTAQEVEIIENFIRHCKTHNVITNKLAIKLYQEALELAQIKLQEVVQQ